MDSFFVPVLWLLPFRVVYVVLLVPMMKKSKSKDLDQMQKREKKV